MSGANGRSVHAPTSRPKPAPPGLEKADHELNLGEFQDVDTLTLSEASLVINALVAKRKMDRKNINETEYVPDQARVLLGSWARSTAVDAATYSGSG